MRLFATIALALIASTGLGQNRSEQPPVHHRNVDVRANGQSNSSSNDRVRRSRWSDGSSSSSMQLFRQAMQSELKHVPILHEKIDRLVDIQSERISLFRKRSQIAQKGGEPTDVALQQFHQVLKDEEALNARQEQLKADFAKDAEVISQQVAARRAQVQEDIEKARKAGDPKKDLKSLQRLDRMYSVLQERMENLEEESEAGDWLRKFSRGFWQGSQEELDPQLVEKIRHRVEQLQQDQEGLRRRLTEIDEEMDELRDLLESNRPFRGRTGNPPHHSPPAPHGNPPPGNPGPARQPLGQQ